MDADSLKERARELADNLLRLAGLETEEGALRRQLEENLLREGVDLTSMTFTFGDGDDKLPLREPGWEKIGDFDQYRKGQL